jgi:hypothetical protein
MCIIALGASACGAIPANALTPTPTTLMGIILPNGQSTEIPTEIPTDSSTQTPGADLGNQEDLVDICPMIPPSEAEAVLGQPVTSINPGMDQDGISGGTLYFCTYLGTGMAVVLSLEDVSSTDAAKQLMGQQLVKMLADDASTTSTMEGGLGDQSYWSTSEHAAQFTVVKGNYIFSVLLGGNIGDPAAHKAALLILAEFVAATL